MPRFVGGPLDGREMSVAVCGGGHPLAQVEIPVPSDRDNQATAIPDGEPAVNRRERRAFYILQPDGTYHYGGDR